MWCRIYILVYRFCILSLKCIMDGIWQKTQWSKINKIINNSIQVQVHKYKIICRQFTLVMLVWEDNYTIKW